MEFQWRVTDHWYAFPMTKASGLGNNFIQTSSSHSLLLEYIGFIGKFIAKLKKNLQFIFAELVFHRIGRVSINLLSCLVNSFVQLLQFSRIFDMLPLNKFYNSCDRFHQN